ncbi:exported hypothetical protein [Candidatus Sulfopaludibacter sp. SbA3]|nr:exported hypothetical protein [Candidatus Sulfopaludibacter sp. SbA3]
MSAPIDALAGGVLTVAAACALGTLMMQRLAIALTRLEFRLFALLAGSACLSALVLLLASLQLARKGVFLALAAVAIVSACRAPDSVTKTVFSQSRKEKSCWFSWRLCDLAAWRERNS